MPPERPSHAAISIPEGATSWARSLQTPPLRPCLLSTGNPPKRPGAWRSSPSEWQLREALLEQYRDRQWLRARGRQRTDATHVLGANHAINRVACVAEAMRHAFDRLAVVAPEWLQAHSRAKWLERGGRRAEDDCLPESEPPRLACARTVGLDAIDAEDAPVWLREGPAVKKLRLYPHNTADHHHATASAISQLTGRTETRADQLV